MRTLLIVAVFLSSFSIASAQKIKVPAKHYPSLFWEISGKGMTKPSYLFGTMHVSSKMVFHLSDSFYLGIKNADVVALETNMGTWQEDFSRYDTEESTMPFNHYGRWRNGYASPSDYFNIFTLQFRPYEKMIEMALYNSPSIINNFLYRSRSDKQSDFEEDTYLDLHIYQAGKKWGKKVMGVEQFDQSMQLMKEAYEDASKEKNKKQRSYEYDQDFSYSHMEDAYRTGNLDLLDTINKVNSMSAAFDEKFLYKRNDIQAASIDSILKTRSTLFVGVGAAHLPGQRGVIEILRRMGYRLRPIKMSERDSRHKEEVEKIRVPVQFSKQTSGDGFFSVNMPGKFYDFNGYPGAPEQLQFADMSNGSYYMVTRINTHSLMWGHTEEVVLKKIDSVIYENIPGKILSKTAITKNGYKGYEVMNRTRRGDYQRYNIFVTPFEIILFKMSGNAEYVRDGKEANQFFSSIAFTTYKNEWRKWSPTFGGFEVVLPHKPVVVNDDNWHFIAIDKTSGTGFEVIRTDIHNYDFVEEDSFDLNLMEESFATSGFIDKQLSKKQGRHHGYAVLDASYQYKDGSFASVKFLVQGVHYYMLVAHAKSENQKMHEFLNSFNITPFVYGKPVSQADTTLYFTVKSPVLLEKTKKISMVPDNGYGFEMDSDNDLVEETQNFRSKLVSSDSTGEKVYVSFSKPSRYYFDNDTLDADAADTTHFKTNRMNWVYRNRKRYELPNKMEVFEYVLGDPGSSRYVKGKLFSRDAVTYRLETQGDTLSGESDFIKSFFATFQPSDTVKGTIATERKTKIFFADFFSQDTMLHKRAVKNVNRVSFDSTDFDQLKKSINSLTWNEKKYIDVKKSFLWTLSAIKTKEAANFLKDVYFAAQDTVELQYVALEGLLHQKTRYAYQVFRDIMSTDPPVLDMSRRKRSNVMYVPNYNRVITTNRSYDYDNNERSQNGAFMSELVDSLALTTSIFKDLLPLINVNDYEQPIMELMVTLVDSNQLRAKAYEPYFTKFLLEAKQEMKKQVIREKNKSIETAQKEDEESNNYNNREDNDYGNSQLDLYATLLMPFWNKNPGVAQLINQMLRSEDKRLKYNTTLLLVRHNKPIPDTILNFLAGQDDFRYELFADLKRINQSSLFPAAYHNHVDLARSKLLFSGTNGNDKPDSVIYIDKLPVSQHGRDGFVYFFKYKQKKNDVSWKLATVGIISDDPKQFDFPKADSYWEENKYDFTEMKGIKIESDEPLKEQMNKLLKKMQYSKRNSAAEFYEGEDREEVEFFRQ